MINIPKPIKQNVFKIGMLEIILDNSVELAAILLNLQFFLFISLWVFFFPIESTIHYLWVEEEERGLEGRPKWLQLIGNILFL